MVYCLLSVKHKNAHHLFLFAMVCPLKYDFFGVFRSLFTAKSVGIPYWFSFKKLFT